MSFSRRAAAFGHGRRRGRELKRSSSGPVYLLDYGDATFSRSSEAAYVDPREGWAFVQTGFESSAFDVFPTIGSWSTVGGASVVSASEADPFGGTSACIVEDNDGPAYEFIRWAGSGHSPQAGQRWQFILRIKKDTDTTRYPEIAFRQASGSHAAHIQVNTQTGAVTLRTSSGWSNVAVSGETDPLDSDWWKLTLSATVSSTTSFDALVYPAFSTVYGGATATTGTLTFDPRIEIRRHLAWKRTDEPRIYSDGAILVEDSRTNLITYSANLASWTNSGADLTSGQTAPDGIPNAYRVGDSSAAANRYVYSSITASATGSHCWSAYFLKDADTSRFPELLLVAGTGTISGGTIAVQLNTSTGATTTRSGTPVAVKVHDAGDWWRLTVTATVSATGTVETRVYPAITTTWGAAEVTATGAVTVWGVQCEAGGYATSPIRTTGATATRAVEQPSYAAGSYASALATGKAKWSVWPRLSSADMVTHATGALSVYRGGANEGLILRAAGGSTRVAYFNAIGAPKLDQVVTFSAGQRLDITCDFGTDEITISGATTGDGTYTLSSTGSEIDPGTDALYIGYRGSSPAQFFQGVISRPEAA